MSTINLEDMTPEELLSLGEHIGTTSIKRPDITHQIMVGIRTGMEHGPNPTGYGFGALLEGLWRWWHHHVSDVDTSPPIPFNTKARPSGVGLDFWQFQKRV